MFAICIAGRSCIIDGVSHDPLDLIERARRRLHEEQLACTTAGPASAEAIEAAEAALACKFPPSYRAFLRAYGALALPAKLATIHTFVGLGASYGVVERTQHARVENRLPEHLVIVGLGAEVGEWFVIDSESTRPDGEGPILLFDARENAVDQQFYDDFGQMLSEVMTFAIETLDEGFDHGSGASETSLTA